MTDKLSDVARAIFETEIYQGYNAETKERQWMMGENTYRAKAKAAIAAHLKALEAEGLVIVPREPTVAMVKAGDAKPPIMATLSSDCSDGLGVYQAMLAALEVKDADN